MSKICVTTFLTFILTALSSQAAFFTADLPNPQSDPSKGTHLLIVGKGLEVGDQWLRIAHTQALVFRDRGGTGQIHMIAAIEDQYSVDMMRELGYQNLKTFNRTMNDQEVLNDILKTKKIESIDFIGHNGALYGFALEDYSERFFLPAVDQLKQIKSRMSATSFIRLYGCNTGWYLAPAMANALNVPVGGSFTFADIQGLHELNEWFYNDEGRFPPGQWLKSNALTYSQPQKCTGKTGCLRMKVVNSSYQGKHGSYGGTLPFLKFFCGGLETNDCFRRMAMSTTSMISVKAIQEKPSRQDFAAVLADQFCPAWKDAGRRQECQTKVMNHVLKIQTLPDYFSTTDETNMTCDFKSCKMTKDCSSGSCVVTSTVPGPSKTFVNELNAFMRGYELW